MAKKPKIPAIQNRTELLKTVDEISTLEVEKRRLIAERDAALQLVNKQRNPKIEELDKRMKDLVKISSDYVVANTATVFSHGLRSANSPLATFGLRNGTPALKLLSNKYSWEGVLTKMKSLGEKYLPFIRTIEEIDKEALKDAKLNDVDLAGLGLRIDQGTSFYITPRSEDADRQKTPITEAAS